MAYEDALFQLGMDLTRSSTAQKEDLARAPSVSRDLRRDHFIERDGVTFAGKHLIIDLIGAKRLDDARHIEATLRRCTEAAGATLLSAHVHPSPSGSGVAGVAVLAESHITIHSWPEARYAALDIFMSGNADPHRALPILMESFEAEDIIVTEHRRGEAIGARSLATAGRSVEQARPARMSRTKQRQAA